MKTICQLLAVAGLIAAIFICSGWPLVVVGAAAGAAAGTVAYMDGELKGTLGTSMDKSCKATEKAMKQLKFIVNNQTCDTLSGEVTARTAQDKKIVIKLNKETDQSTKVSIRVDTFGDQAISQQIWEEIRTNVK